MGTEELESAVKEQAAMDEAVAKFYAATSSRDAAVAAARSAGNSAIEIAAALRLSRQQVHKILERTVPAEVKALRDEVVTGEVRYEDLLDDDKAHADWAIREIARERGLGD